MANFIIPRQPLSRRTVLRGLGASVALPFLDAMRSTARAASSAAPPVRLGVVFMPNGVPPKLWTPEGAGRDFKFSPLLKPLEKHRADINVFTNLGHRNCEEGDGHYAKTANWLTGTPIAKTTGKDLRCGVSLDQIIAQRRGHLTRLPSLELGTEPIHPGVDFNVNYTTLYGDHISWSTPTIPLPPEINPRFVFDRLFRQNHRTRTVSAQDRKSILDLVMSDAKGLRSRVGKEDQQRVDDYLESIRNVEQRIEADISRVATGENLNPAMAGEITSLDKRIQAALAAKPPEAGGRMRLDHTEHSRLMLDLMTLAFWSDSTRASTFMFGWAVSGRSFSFLPGCTNGHHDNSHHDNHEDKLEQYRKITTWHLDQFSYMLDRMKSIKEGDGTLLDNTLLLFGSSMRDGNAHDPHNLPLVVAGHGGGVKGGQHYQSDPKTPLCNLYLSLLQKSGIEMERFGDSSGAFDLA